ncbi:hypothetical protein MGN70_006427 [Eutypa lata]|nr:hypothetical protein MGN70_006427 [Eutypa lata]
MEILCAQGANTQSQYYLIYKARSARRHPMNSRHDHDCWFYDNGNDEHNGDSPCARDTVAAAAGTGHNCSITTWTRLDSYKNKNVDGNTIISGNHDNSNTIATATTIITATTATAESHGTALLDGDNDADIRPYLDHGGEHQHYPRQGIENQKAHQHSVPNGWARDCKCTSPHTRYTVGQSCTEYLLSSHLIIRFIMGIGGRAHTYAKQSY